MFSDIPETSTKSTFNNFLFLKLNLNFRYTFGKVIGTGTYGIVRKCYDKASSRKYAVKSIPKVPKKGKVPSTPRYLLKIRNEVDLMTQLGGSLNSVHLKVTFSN